MNTRPSGRIECNDPIAFKWVATPVPLRVLSAGTGLSLLGRMPSATHGPAKNEDLHGSVPDESPVVVIAIDVINDLEFPGGEELEEPAFAMACELKPLLERAREAGIPVIYANDNFGKWRSDFRVLLDHCLNSASLELEPKK
jgi:hypothetical protein